MKEMTVNIHGITIAIKRWGAPSGVPVLALHGWLDNANSFDLLIPYLGDHLCVYALDLPGHGLSSHLPQSACYHFIDGIYHIIDVADALDLDSFYLLGHSLGACLASMVAGVIPARIPKLAMIDAIGPLVANANESLEQTLSYIGRRQSLKNKVIRHYNSLNEAASARATRGHIPVNLAHILCQRGCRKTDGLYRWRHDEKLLLPSPLRMTEKQVLPFLKNISAKSTLVFASEGFGSHRIRLQERINSVKNLTTVSVDGGHHIHMEAAPEVAQIINKLFNAS